MSIFPYGDSRLGQRGFFEASTLCHLFATGLPPKTPPINRSRAIESQGVLIRIRGTPSVCLAPGAAALLPQRSNQKYMWGVSILYLYSL